MSINFLQAQTNVSGVISANTSWTKAGSPYVVTGNILVNSGVLLTINPGVEIRFDAGKYLKIEGEISAVGLADDSILFTSNSSNKTKGSWDKIWLKGTASSYADNYDYTSGSIFKYLFTKRFLMYMSAINVFSISRFVFSSCTVPSGINEFTIPRNSFSPFVKKKGCVCSFNPSANRNTCCIESQHSSC